MLIADSQALFYAVTAAVLLSAATVVLRWRPEAGVGLLVSVLVLGPDLRDPVLSVGLRVGGYDLALLDALAVVMLAGAVVHGLVTKRGGAHVVLLLVLGALLAVNVLRGVAAFGLQQAVNESRQWFYLLATVAFGVTLPLRDVRRWRQFAVLSAGWLVLVAVVGLLDTGVQPATAPIQVDGQLMDPRPVTAPGALLLAEALLLVLARSRNRYRALVSAAALGGTLLVLQHRTVWIAALAALLYLTAVALRGDRRARLAALVAAGAVTVAALTAFLTGTAQRSAVAVSAENVAAADNTFIWRVTGWRELLQAPTDVTKVVFGDPFGSGFRRVISGQLVTVSPHSQYVETLLRFGVVGLALSVGVFLLAWRGAPAAAGTIGASPAALRALLMVAALYGIAYRLDPLQGLLIGTVLGLASAAGDERQPLPGHRSLAEAGAR